MSLENPIGSNNGMEVEPEQGPADLDAAAAVPLPEEDPGYAGEEAGLSWVEMLHGVIARPAATLRAVSHGDYLVNALLIFLAVEGVAWFLQIAMAARGPTADTFARLFPLLAVTAIPRAVVKLGMLMAVVGVLGSIIFLVAGAGIFSLLAEVFLGGKGNARGLLAGLALATLPTVLGAPFQLISFLFSWPSFIINLVSLALWVWTLALKVMAIREAAEVSTARAIAVYLIPGASIAVLVMIALVGGAVTMVPLLGGFGG